MCDYYLQRLEDVDRGDLADVVFSCHRPPAADRLHLPSNASSTQHRIIDNFSVDGDPLLIVTERSTAGSGFLETTSCGTEGGGGGGDEGGSLSEKVINVMGEEMKNKQAACDRRLFSRVNDHQISPRMAGSSATAGGEMVKASSSHRRRRLELQGGGLHLSSLRAPGIKRRKYQAKKVVCIPAPTTTAAAAASNRWSGETAVPCDLWAWRKYGQKPIKGSPYPRGYYRCSSSKGCSARKQVERSRNDPNMLVVTYTSEHNHPWPTQRSGSSTRSHPSMINTSTAASVNSNRNNPKSPLVTAPNEDPKDTVLIKKPISHPDEVFHHNCEPVTSQDHDLFSDLAALESDPMSLIFSGGLIMEAKQVEEVREDNLDPFDMLL
ncbi:putative WRKY transcription factor 14 [Canna indica]|uniref:WRKY transcription factor 14 n=1 Tax=Canna indica TaxID=4628 RepID=A0AAQ3KBF6_9LILI|nr:putative WRKY transcription factor 14 [Canna indica]